MSRTSAAKLQREKDRRARAAAKAERRAQRSDAEVETSSAPSGDEEAALLSALADLHARFDAGSIDFEAFEAARDEITQRLQG